MMNRGYLITNGTIVPIDNQDVEICDDIGQIISICLKVFNSSSRELNEWEIIGEIIKTNKIGIVYPEKDFDVNFPYPHFTYEFPIILRSLLILEYFGIIEKSNGCYRAKKYIPLDEIISKDTYLIQRQVLEQRIEEDTISATYSRHEQIIKNIIYIMSVDFNEGIRYWCDWIKVAAYERRPEDCMKMMLNEVHTCFGSIKIIEMLKEQEYFLELFLSKCYFQNYELLDLAIDFGEKELFSKILYYLGRNIYYERIKEIIDCPNRYNYLKERTKEFKKIVGEIKKSFAYSTTNKEFKEWESTVNVNHKNYVKQYIINDSDLHIRQKREIFYLPNEEEFDYEMEYRIKNILSDKVNPVEKLKQVKDILLLLQEKYYCTVIFPVNSSKAGKRNIYIAEHSNFYYHIGGINDFDNSDNVICCFTKENNYLSEIIDAKEYLKNTIQHHKVISMEKSCVFAIAEIPIQRFFEQVNLNDVSDGKRKIAYEQELQIKEMFLEQMLSAKMIENTKEFTDACKELWQIMHQCKQGNTVSKYDYDDISLLKMKIDNEITRLRKYKPRWIKERLLYELILTQYPDAIFQYRAPWLEGQIYDIYIPSVKVAVEYNGIQHYEAIDIFGGEEGLVKTQKRDARKRRLSKNNGVKCIEWKYDEVITILLFKEKFKKICL